MNSDAWTIILIWVGAVIAGILLNLALFATAVWIGAKVLQMMGIL